MKAEMLEILKKLQGLLNEAQHALDAYVHKISEETHAVRDKDSLALQKDETLPSDVSPAKDDARVPSPNLGYIQRPPLLSEQGSSVGPTTRPRANIDYDTCIFGIDLGTTTTKVSYNKKGGAHVPIKIGHGQTDFYMPSLVCYEEGRLLVGEKAEESPRAEDNRNIKLRLGKIAQLSNEEKEQLAKILTEILKEAVRRVSLTDEFNGLDAGKMKVNISTSSDFDLEARKLLVEAAKRAGLVRVTLENIVEEPVAAGLAYIDKCAPKEPLYVLVCDYGGGTFDTSLICAETSREGVKNVEVLASAGVSDCGGAAIDDALLRHFTDKVEGLKERLEDPLSRTIFKRYVEQIKIDLSRIPQVERDITEVFGESKNIQCSQAVIKEMVDKEGILIRSFDAIKWVIQVGVNSRRQGIGGEDVFMSLAIPKNIKVLFAGGTSNIGYIREGVLSAFGLSHLNEVTQEEFSADPMEAVVLGDSYSKAFCGVNLNRPPAAMFLEVSGQKTRIQESFEGFLEYKGPKVREYRSLAEKRYSFHVNGIKYAKIYFLDTVENCKVFFKRRGGYWDDIKEDIIELNGSYEVVRSRCGEIKIQEIVSNNVSNVKCKYAAPWKTDEQISMLHEWHPPNINECDIMGEVG